MGIKLLELKIGTEDRHDYLVKESVCEEIVNWECLSFMSGVESVKEYMETNPYPEDKLYSKQDFLKDVERATGYILLSVEKTETAEYIAELVYDLI